MIEIRKNQGEVILSREQLERIEGFQSEFSNLTHGIRESVEEFENVILRHYFNRENGFLDLQLENLRELDELRDRLSGLAGQLSGGAAELRDFLREVRPEKESRSVRGTAGHEVPGNTPPSPDRIEHRGAQEGKGDVKTPGKVPAGGEARRSPLVLADAAQLEDVSIQGGEISIRLFFEELGILRPERRELLKDITRQLHDLLYDRKLVGYSKTSLVFGRDRTLAQVLESLNPIFLSEQIRAMLDNNFTVPPGAELHLGCTRERELVYVVSERTGS